MINGEDIKRIKTGQKFTVFLSNLNNLYGSGCNKYGQLG
jgi:alpha-tubulin suppressor-like RCC1 family protein